MSSLGHLLLLIFQYHWVHELLRWLLFRRLCCFGMQPNMSARHAPMLFEVWMIVNLQLSVMMMLLRVTIASHCVVVAY